MKTMTFRINTPAWNITELNGYEPQTTFWQDFSIAERFGLSAIKDTFKRAFQEWRDETVYVTELAMVLNHKGFYWYDTDKMRLSELYFSLWQELDEWCANNLKGEDLAYYYRITD